MDLAAVVD